MNLGALIDLEIDKNYLISELSKLNLDSEYEIKIEKALKNGIGGTKVDVILKNHEHNNAAHNKGNYHVHEHHHRNLDDIKSIINNSALKDSIKKLSIDIFMKVAEAEAVVHNKPLNEIPFHEVGAIDSIIDIVGAAICIDYLKVDKILASSVQVGGGFVKCAHGTIPIPAPATVEILKNIPIKSGIVQSETTTPTGAAILAANVEKFIDQVDFSIEKIGYGIGHRDLEIPNVLRVYIGKIEKSKQIEEQYIIETNIDDMSPELCEYIEEKLFASGALDVYKTYIVMKKGRPATKLTILTDLKSERSVLDVIFKETTTIGVRKYKVDKIMLDRKFVQVDTKYGVVRVKKSYYNGELAKYKAEYEDCKEIASQNNITILDVYKEVNKVFEENNILT
jgi:uncharacterized protein (TIGR00299 family) protein